MDTGVGMKSKFTASLFRLINSVHFQPSLANVKSYLIKVILFFKQLLLSFIYQSFELFFIFRTAFPNSRNSFLNMLCY